MSNKSAIDIKKRRSQLLVALITALIPVVITFAIRIFEKEVKELSLYYSKSEKILTNKSALQNDIRLYYDSLRVQNISSIKLTIINSGNQYISKDDFIDGPIQFLLVGSNTQDKQPFIINAIEVENAKQRNSILKYSSLEPNVSLEYLPSLLNPGDQIQIEIFISDSEINKVDFLGKLKKGQIKPPLPYELLLQKSKIEKFITSIHDFLGSKWVSIIIFVFFLLSTALGTLTFVAAVQDENNKLTTGAVIVFLLMSVQVLIMLAMLILVTIY